MRIAATADYPLLPSLHNILHDQLSRARDEADVLVLGGGLDELWPAGRNGTAVECGRPLASSDHCRCC